jgi:hypothetical protein
MKRDRKIERERRRERKKEKREIVLQTGGKGERD